MYNSRSRYHEVLPLMHLFLSNDVPSDYELAQLDALLREVETEFTRDLAAGSTANMERLLQYDPLGSLRRSLKGAMSPIRRVPEEIISNIFLMCLPISPGGTSCNSLTLGNAPWTLTMVSKRWRGIALNDQRLWSSIDLNKASVLSKLNACLARSRQHPLTIRFSHILWPTPLRELLPSSERWESLVLERLDRDSLEPLKQIKGHLSVLRELIIRPDPDFFFDSDKFPKSYRFDSFEHAPELRKAAIDFLAEEEDLDEDLIFWIDPAQFILPWCLLTSLKTDNIDVLRHCHQLVDCEVQIPTLNSRTLTIYIPTQPITLSNLRRLTVSELKIIDVLVLPSLEYLSIQGFVTHERMRSLNLRFHRTLNTLDVRKAWAQEDILRLTAEWPNINVIGYGSFAARGGGHGARAAGAYGT